MPGQGAVIVAVFTVLSRNTGYAIVPRRSRWSSRSWWAVALHFLVVSNRAWSLRLRRVLLLHQRLLISLSPGVGLVLRSWDAVSMTSFEESTCFGDVSVQTIV